MTRTCPHCGSSEIDEDAGRGDATCMACGTVLEESIVVSENQFQERAGGTGHTLVGQFVSAERAQAQARSGGLVSQESREVTFAKGRKLIEEIASQLRINQHCIDTAYNFFKMSVSRNLTRGRIRSHVVVACLYMTCRLENTAHLLLDFSDVTQVNVFDLGRTLSFLSRSLRINLPSTDPCLYVMRFACLLEFGDKQKEVVTLATRLVQRMKRDWISTGRRPTGLCGAALLLAARSFNFNRTISDVVKVVHISEAIVRKRLEEFGQTPSGSLTIDEFTTIDLEHCEDPPAFREARRKAREEQLAREAELAARMEKEILPIEEELERALEKKRREKFKQTRYAKLVAGDLDDPEVGKAEEALVRDEVVDTVFRAVDEDEESAESCSYNKFAPSLQSLGISQTPTSNNGMTRVYPPIPPQDLPDGSLDLTGIDDDEIDTYILTAKESEVKERFWMKLNGEHLKEMERRRKEREEEEEKEKDNPTKKKRRRPLPQRRSLASDTAVEAMEKIIHEKKLSNKVNYDILKEIEQTASGMDGRLDRDNSQVIKNVNELVSTLGMNTAIPEDAISNVNQSIPLTPENMTRREREMSRRNKPLKDPSALRNAFKIEMPSSVDAGSESQDFKRPIPLNRSRYGRLSSLRPNLSTAGQHKPAVHVTSLLEDVKPPNFASMSVRPEVHIDATQHTDIGKDDEADKTTSDESAALPSITREKDCDLAQPSQYEHEKADAAIMINGSTMLVQAKSVDKLNKLRAPPENLISAQNEVTNSEIAKKGALVDSSQPAEHLLRRGRRSLVKPKVLTGAEESASLEEFQNTTETNEEPKDNSTAAGPTNAPHPHLLRRGRKPLAKPVITSASTKSDNVQSSHEEPSANEHKETIEKNDVGATLLRRGRKPLLKPKLTSSNSEGKGSTNTSNDTHSEGRNEAVSSVAEVIDLEVDECPQSKESSEVPTSAPRKRLLKSSEISEPFVLKRPKPSPRIDKNSMKR